MCYLLMTDREKPGKPQAATPPRPPPLPRGGYSEKNWVGVCSPLPKRPNNEQPNEHKTNESPAEQNQGQNDE